MSKKKPKKSPPAGRKTAPSASGEVRLSQHPRAKQQIRLAKGWAGLAGCVFAGYASWKGGAPFVDSALRALLWGMAAYLLVWFCAVQVWRHVAIAEVRAAEKVWRARRDEAERVHRERVAEAVAQAQAGRAATGSSRP